VTDPLPGGLNEVDIEFAGQTHTLVVGVPFDFTAHVANGVDEFSLLGLDPALPVDPSAPAPFTTGFTFAEEGVVELAHAAIPEPSTLINLSLLGALGMAAGWYRWRKPA